jgi:hypothetical protein
MTDLQQLKITLPPDLLAYVQEQASRSDRTASGQVRHWIAEQKRREPPAERIGVSDAFAPPVPAVPATVEGVAAARERLAALRDEEQKLRKRKSRWETTIDEDSRVDRIVAEVEVLSKRIAAAERMLPRPNGGQSVV